jgi:hypothetical protein
MSQPALDPLADAFASPGNRRAGSSRPPADEPNKPADSPTGSADDDTPSRGTSSNDTRPRPAPPATPAKDAPRPERPDQASQADQAHRSADTPSALVVVEGGVVQHTDPGVLLIDLDHLAEPDGTPERVYETLSSLRQAQPSTARTDLADRLTDLLRTRLQV